MVLKSETLSVIGLGYVGLPVALAFGKIGRVIAYDINSSRLEELRNGVDKTRESSSEELKRVDLHFTDNPEELRKASIHIIAVPTPVNQAKQPDLTPLLNATKTVGKILKTGDLVIYESTVYPGCTEEECVPLLEKCSGLKYLSNEIIISKKKKNNCLQKVEGFHVGYSPERINPSDKKHTLTNIKKIVSGSNTEALEKVYELYRLIVKVGVHKVSTIKIAEAAKVIENAQRDINIAFVNELAMIFNYLDIDTSEVLKAAGTKWNFLPFQPGLVGGHCVGVDPYYLTYRAEKAGFHSQIILSGRKINDSMGVFIAKETIKSMAKVGLSSIDSTVTILGLTFKENCSDLRNSKVIDIINELTEYGCRIQIHDPYCYPEEVMKQFGMKITPLKDLNSSSALILAVAHNFYMKWSPKDWIKLLIPRGIVIDVKNSTPSKEIEKAGHIIWKL